MTSQKKKIFVSYSGKDKTFVDQLVADLRKNGLEVWEYSNGIKAGESIPSKIGTELNRADYYVIVLSPNSAASKWVERELNSAIEIENSRSGSEFIIPVLYQEVERPILISAKRYANFVAGYSVGLEELLNTLAVDDTVPISQKMKAKEFEERINMFLKTDVPGLLVNALIPNLLHSVADKLAEDVLQNVIKPSLLKWRQGVIATLKEIEPTMRNSSSEWAKSETIKRLISSEVYHWLDEIRQAINKSTNPICSEYGVPLNSIGNSILNTEVDLSNIDKFKFSTDPYPEEIGMFVGVIAYAVYTTIALDLVVTGLWGIIISFVIGTIILFVGSLKSNDVIKSWKMPKALRELALSDSKIEEICRENRSGISKNIFKELDNDELKASITKSMRDLINSSIKQEISNLVLLIH